MLVSSNEAIKDDDTFDCQAYFKALCHNTKIQVPDSIEIDFGKGWASIVRRFVEQVKTYTINIYSITDKYSVLDIHFDGFNTNKEVKVWRAINDVRDLSKGVCANCGVAKSSRQKFKISKYCEKCSKNSHKLSQTGTWLDKY